MTNIEYAPKEIKAFIVATNYNFLNAQDFVNTIDEKNIIKKYSIEPCNTKIRFLGIPPQTQEDVNSLALFAPVICKDTVNDIQVDYINPEKKLMIRKENFTELIYENFKNLAYDLMDLRLSTINAIGVNYSADFVLGDVKLNLINNNIINEIPDFSKNMTFEFVLPLNYDDRGLIATYRVKKVQGGDESNEPRIYNVGVNFHFDISSLNTKNKSEKLDEILSKELYEEFINKSQGFLKLNDQKETN